jgi:hypothetical protein
MHCWSEGDPPDGDVAHGDVGSLACGPARCRPTTPCQAAERQRSRVPAGLGGLVVDCNYVDLVHGQERFWSSPGDVGVDRSTLANRSRLPVLSEMV